MIYEIEPSSVEFFNLKSHFRLVIW